MIANALPRPLTAGSVDNAILRADGTGGTILQNSNIVIDDVATATQDNVAILNASSATNSALVLTPKGTGAFILGPKPDGTTTGGNARGIYAVDLGNAARGSATRVASGNYSFVVGEANTASNIAAVAMGRFSTASGHSSFAIINASAAGDYAIALGLEASSSAFGGVSITYQSLADRRNMLAHAGGQFSAKGDAQRARFVMRNKTTTNTAVELFLDGSSTRLTIPSGKIFAFTINIAGVSSTGAAVAHYMRQYCLKNVAGTTTEVYAPITIGTDNAAGTSIALSASDAADALVVSVTGTASTIWRWVASVDAVEIAYGT